MISTIRLGIRRKYRRNTEENVCTKYDIINLLCCSTPADNLRIFDKQLLTVYTISHPGMNAAFQFAIQRLVSPQSRQIVVSGHLPGLTKNENHLAQTVDTV